MISNKLNVLMLIYLIGSAIHVSDGSRIPQERIVGGDFGDIRHVPYQVSVQFLHGHFCGGSIIDEDVVLTAAHCTFGTEDPPKYIYINAGTTELDRKKGQHIKVKQIVQHEFYDSITHNYDISILILENKLNFTEKVSPIKLASSQNAIVPGGLAKIAGWGALYEGSESEIYSLREVNVPILTDDECKAIYPQNITENMFCAGYREGGRDACQGDSGGPLVCENHQIGIVSWGIGCARPNFPTVYTKIPELFRWISENIYKYKNI